MTLKKILRNLLIGLLVFIGVLVIFIVFSVVPIDRTPAHEFSSYESMMDRLERLDTVNLKSPKNNFSVGFAKVNLTPAYPTALSVSGSRRGKVYTAVRDSIYVRTMVLDNGTQKVAIVSA